MSPAQHALLLGFRGTAHVFHPAFTAVDAYESFNARVVPTLEQLQVEGFLRIRERQANRLFTPGGPYAAYHCELTPRGQAVRLRLLQGAPAAA